MLNPRGDAPELLPKLSTLDLELDTSMPPTAGSTFFIAKMEDFSVTSFDVVFEGKVVQEWVETIEITSLVTPRSSS
ncbi:hypothetical protein PM082_006804 [Marasmius tenuissimus]|nr:hypothetical protein PM082_006804 [Marasmius tenuissimus]